MECFSFIIKPDFKWEAGIHQSRGEMLGSPGRRKGEPLAGLTSNTHVREHSLQYKGHSFCTLTGLLRTHRAKRSVN